MAANHGSTCCVCHETLSNSNTLEMHIATEHVFYLAYECEHCETAPANIAKLFPTDCSRETVLFPTDYALRQHYQLVHGQTSFVIKYRVTPDLEEKRNLLEKLLNTSISQSHTTSANVTPPNCNSNEAQFQDRTQFQDRAQFQDRMPTNNALSGQTNGSWQNEQMPSFSALLKFNDVSGEVDSSHLVEEMNGTNDHSLISGLRDLNRSTEPVLPMSCSKPLPPFVCDSLYYLNRDQLERFSIVCRSLKSFIDRYRHSKPYRIFDQLYIRGYCYIQISCYLYHNGVQWHPNRDDYSAQQFLAGQESQCQWNGSKYYSFAEMLPFLSPTVRIKKTFIDAGDSIYNSDHVAEMESISYLWRDYDINFGDDEGTRIVAENFQPILDSPTILQCRQLNMDYAHFSFKDYKVLFTVEVMQLTYSRSDNVDPNDWADFLEQPGIKPIVVLRDIHRKDIDNLLVRLNKDFSSAVVPNAFKIVFLMYKDEDEDEPLTEFRDTNKTSGETLELKKRLLTELPVEYQEDRGLQEILQLYARAFQHLLNLAMLHNTLSALLIPLLMLSKYIITSESEESFEGSKSSSKRKAYTVEFKLQVVDFAKKSSNHAAANKYKVDRKCVKRWRKNEVSLCRAKSSSRDGKSKKKLGCGRKVSYEMLDNDLAAWIRQRRKEKKKISRRIIKLQAESMFNPELEGTDFKASTGWLEKFMKRHRFSLRERTTVCQKPPSDYTQKLVDFVMFVAQLRKNKSYHHIYAADETPFYLDAIGGKCVDDIGVKEVSVLTTGHEKTRITVMLTARDDGRKLPPFILLPRKRPVPAVCDKFKSKLILIWSGDNAWMNNSLVEEYLDKMCEPALMTSHCELKTKKSKWKKKHMIVIKLSNLMICSMH
ncbi:tc5 transposase DNA-binding domain-containing protein [Ditylenchus destructor]|nr:tc5 transposase DNA-binding domain-containing protein [Ditylenchus destructor]